MIVNGVHFRLIRAMQVTVELEIVGGISKDYIDRMIGQTIESGDAIAFENGVEPGGLRRCLGQFIHETDNRHGILDYWRRFTDPYGYCAG